jgi:FtsP/CotA-like multicopper oxidase with cupredoxin domain
MVVNGKVWPRMSVSNSVYRLRIVNVCTARALNISFFVDNNYMDFYVVKADSNYLD